jgi:opacity protein-like surface antigen
MWARVRAGSKIDLNAFMFQQFLNAEHMIGIADGKAFPHSIPLQDNGNPLGGLRGVGGLRLGDETGLGNAAAHEVVVAYASFAITGILSRASGCNDHGCESTPKQIEGVVKAGAINGRRSSRVFRGAKHYNGVGFFELLKAGIADDAEGNEEHRNGDQTRHEN